MHDFSRVTRETAMEHPTARRIFHRWAGGMLLVLTAVVGCDTLDPTKVNNPNPTAEDLANASEPTRALLPGLRAQMARALTATTNANAIISDDYEIGFSNITGEVNSPHAVTPDGGTYNTYGGYGIYWNLQELRAFGDFILQDIIPGDPSATNAQRAEAHFLRGMAYLIQGENFTAVPNAPDTDPLPWGELLGLAIQDFEAAIGLSPGAERVLSARAALARAHRAAGNAAQAESFAVAALSADPEFVVAQRFFTAEIENPNFPPGRSRQPLPRLDFLDPKADSRDTPVALTKAEEMHLILSEVAMSRGAYAEAAGHIADAVRLAHTRPRGQAISDDLRTNFPGITVRPRTAGILVRADAESPFRDGLVITRPGPVEVPLVSGTSLDADSVAALVDAEEIRHAHWLARQEIFFLEGRRLNDLGVRLPIAAMEIDTSPRVSRGDPAATVQVPNYIPTGNAVNEFSPRSPYVNQTGGGELATNEVTILVDLNRILARERVSRFGALP
jgi:tetratricopeptide (TPR) repeat protein